MRLLLITLILFYTNLSNAQSQEEIDTTAFPIDTSGWHVYDDTTKARMLLDSAHFLWAKLHYINLDRLLHNQWTKTIILASSNKLHRIKYYNLIGNIFSWEEKVDSLLKNRKHTLKIAVNIKPRLPKTIGYAHFQLGQAYRVNNQFNNAIAHFEKALQIAIPLNLSDLVFNCHMSISNVHTSQRNYKLSKSKLLQLGRENNQFQNTTKKQVRYKVHLGKAYANLGIPDSATIHLRDAQKIYEDLATIVDRILIKDKIAMYSTLGDLSLSTFNHKKAYNLFKKSLELTNELYGENHYQSIHVLDRISQTVATIGDSHKAIEYRQRAIEIVKSQPNVNLQNLGTLLFNQLLDLKSSGNIDGSLTLIKEIDSIFIKAYPKGHLLFGYLYYAKGEISHLENKIDQSIREFENALNIMSDNLGTRSSMVAFVTEKYGSVCFALEDDSKKAEECFLNSLSIYSELYGDDSPTLYWSLFNLGFVDLRRKKYKDAIIKLNKSIRAFGVKDIYSPNFDNVHLPHDIRYALDAKIKAYQGLYKSLSNHDYKDSIAITYSHLISLEEYLSESTFSELSRQYFQKTSKPSYEGAISSILRITNNRKKNTAFEYLESSKSRKLRDEFLINDYSGTFDSANLVHQSLVSLKKKIRMSSNSINALIIQENSDSAALTQQQFTYNLRQKSDSLENILKNRFAIYWEGIRKSRIFSSDSLMHHLNQNQSLLEYFVGDSSIFIFVITQDTFHIEEVKHDFPLSDWVASLQGSILEQALPSPSSENDVFLHSSSNLYEKLISPVSDLLTKNLIVVPDGVLGYIPFDLLVSNDPLRIEDAHYLIQDHQVAYQYSATLWLEMMKKQVNPSKEVLAIAPNFPVRPVNWAEIDSISKIVAARNDLFKLAYANEEVNDISDYWSTQSLTGHLATVQNFIQNASDYRIVHLASHGKADDRVGDYCYLAFTHTSDTLDRKLYVRDLYNMKLNAEMVVLSACETGMGELQQGEGILSLARGFAYAGAKSIVSTLWSVNDLSTKDIMASFYKNLKDGQSKDEALRNAKLGYMEANPGTHPYYWAAFTAVGDMSPIESGWPWWVWGVGLISLLIIGFFFMKKL